MPGITVIGSLNMDLVITSPKIPVMGETILGKGFMTVPGGKGANQAAAASKLGGKVSFIGCVGNDIYGSSLIENLASSGVEISNIKRLEEFSTGIAVIVVSNGNNFIIVDSGANWALTPGDINRAEGLIKESSIIMLQLETPLETVEKAIEAAKKHHVRVLLNPAPARMLSGELLSSVDVLTPNESECEFITGIAIKSAEDAKSAVEFLNQKGVSSVVVTLGGKGVVYNSGKKIIHKPVPDVRVVDTTAAGDAFSGALAVALSQGKTIDEAVDFANIAGTLTVMKKGAQASLPTLKDIQDFIERS